MQEIIPTLFGVILFVVAVLMVRRQLQSRQSFQEKSGENASIEARFNASKCRRRIQCSVILAVLALGMIAIPWIVGPVARVSFGAAMLILLGWMLLLAMLDIMATSTHYRRMAGRYHNEQIRLEAKVKQLLHDGEKEEEGARED